MRDLLSALILLAVAWCGDTLPMLARDNGQWQATDQAVSKWFRELKQPDNPRLSCCGEADAYYSDSFEVDGDHYVAIITDERDDTPLGRPHIAPGTRIAVPNQKMKWDAGNPTGHGVIFVGLRGHVLCYVAPGGV
jgi:hypothetical protein